MAIDNVQQLPDLTSVNAVRDVDPFLRLILTKRPITEMLLVPGPPARQNRHEWFDDQITEQTTTLTADITAHAALATGIAVVVADNTFMKVGDQLFVDLFTPVYEITAVNVNGTDLTVKEVRNKALASTSGNGSVVKYTRGELEITDYTSDSFHGARLGTQVLNFTQAFRQNVQVSEEEIELARAGGIYTQSDIWANAQDRRLEQLAWRMYDAITMGVKLERTTNSTHGMMGGIREFIDVSGGNVVTASGALTLANLNTLAKMIFDDTSDLSNIAIFVPTAESQTLSDLNTTTIRWNNPGSNLSIGINAATYIPNIGGTPGIPIYIDPNMPRNEVWFLDRSKIQLNPFLNFTMKFREATTPGITARQGYFHGVYTLTVRNGAQAHGIIKGFTPSA